MSTKRTSKALPSVPSAPPSIDAVVETPVAKLTEALRGPLASLRPAWIGPPRVPSRPPTPGGSIMTIPITINFGSPGLQPPVYIATSLSDPEWEPTEMEGSKNDSGEYTFSKTFDAQEGQYQYKLRLGPGDWWTCDDSKPQVDDGMGNKNNLITVTAGKSEDDRADSVHEHGAPLMAHENHDKGAHTSPFLHAERNGAPTTPGVEHQAPFFRHESLVPEASEEDDDEDEEETHSPLLRHETAIPTHEGVSPLFRHESTSIDDPKHQDLSNKSPLLRGRKDSGDSIPEEADPNEPGLEQFPTDHKGIIEHIVRTKQSLATDETSDHTPSPSPPQAGAAMASPRLPSLAEDESEEQLDDFKNAPDVQITEADNRPAAPITPPETPTKEKQIDPIAERIQEDAQTAKETVVSAADQAAQKAGTTNYSAVLTGSMFAFAVALTAIGLWYFAESGRNLDVIET